MKTKGKKPPLEEEGQYSSTFLQETMMMLITLYKSSTLDLGGNTYANFSLLDLIILGKMNSKLSRSSKDTPGSI